VSASRKPPDPIREKFAARTPLLNAWLTLGAPFAVELAAEAGCDLVTIDQQHGIGGEAELLASLMAAKAAAVPALVRVAMNDFGLIGRALDAGAQGVVCPMVNTPEETARLVEAVKFPPLGLRSAGPYRARLLLPDYVRGANVWTIACAQIETRRALDNLDAILGTPGLDMICAGPNDLAITLSNGQHADIRAPEVLDALSLLLAKAREKGIIASVFANDADYAMAMLEKGWQIVAIGTDARWITTAAREARRIVSGG
jgi:4-hydroxy-2-oxoheptanedioate aldolase